MRPILLLLQDPEFIFNINVASLKQTLYKYICISVPNKQYYIWALLIVLVTIHHHTP